MLRVEVSDLMKYAGYLPDGGAEDVQAEEPLHQVLSQVSHLTNDQLIVLIDQAWEEYRFRLGFSWNTPVDAQGGRRAAHPR